MSFIKNVLSFGFLFLNQITIRQLFVIFDPLSMIG